MTKPFLTIASILLSLPATVASAGSDFESSKLSPGVVVQGSGFQSSKLSSGVVVQNASFRSSKMSVGVVLVAVASVNGVIPRAPLTHW